MLARRRSDDERVGPRRPRRPRRFRARPTRRSSASPPGCGGSATTHGPDAIAFYVSGQLSIEDHYLVNKLAKGFLGTNNIDSNSRLCMSSAVAGYKRRSAPTARRGSYDDLEHADCILLLGSNMADCHPILFLRILDRVQAQGAKLIVVDPRRTATAGSGRPVPAGAAGHRPRAAERAAAPARADGAVDRRFIADAHRRLGRRRRDARPSTTRRPWPRSPASPRRICARRDADRRRRELGDAVVDGAQPVRPRHLDTPNALLQPVPRHRPRSAARAAARCR